MFENRKFVDVCIADRNFFANGMDCSSVYRCEFLLLCREFQLLESRKDLRVGWRNLTDFGNMEDLPQAQDIPVDLADSA